MPLFSGTACFSPSVPRSLQQTWVLHGGSFARTNQERKEATYFFCAGTDDPWLPELSARSIVVFHAGWISEAVTNRFPVPKGTFVLDDLFDSTGIPSLKPTSIPASVSPSHPSQSKFGIQPNKKRPLDLYLADTSTSTTALHAHQKRARLATTPVFQYKQEDGDKGEQDDEERVAHELVPSPVCVSRKKKSSVRDKYISFWSAFSLSSSPSPARISTATALCALFPSKTSCKDINKTTDVGCAADDYDEYDEEQSTLFKHGAEWRGAVFAVRAVGA